VPGFASLPNAAPVAASVSGGRDARGAIARAAQATGVDFSYLLAQAKLESSLNPSARAGTSSAAGLYQFTQGTWAQVLQQHGAEIGLDGGAAGSTLAALRDPAERARLMALRFDPETSARMAAELAGDNQAMLSASLGRQPSPSELYLAHFLGVDGATRFLSALSTDPTQSAAGLLPKAAGANRSVFYDANGAPRAVGAVMALIEQRMAIAMQDSGDQQPGFSSFPDPATASAMPAMQPAPASPAWAGGLGAEFASAQASASGDGGTRRSMADTLGAAFAIGESGGGSSATPDFVRSAYGRLRALGL
jgi:hypothetical protein